MNPFVHGLVRAAAETFTWSGPILEVGSRIASGQDTFGSARDFFRGRTYLGVDIQPGPGVDLVASVEALPQGDASMGAVIALEILEHVPRFWRAIDEIQRVLADDGLVLISTPFHVHIHNHPGDYWRFTPMALDHLLRPFPQRLVGWYGPESRPIGTWAMAFGKGRPALSEAERATFRQRLGQYSHWPLSPFRRLRCMVGSWLFGRRHFESVLQRNRFDFTWHQDEAIHDQRTTDRPARRAA